MESDLQQPATGFSRTVCDTSQIEDRSRRQASSEVLGSVPTAEELVEVPHDPDAFWWNQRSESAEEKNV
jgi:hypothetical protein